MNKLKLKLKLNKIYERQLLMRRKLWDIEETVNAIEKLHKDNYDAIELLLDILANDMNSDPEDIDKLFDCIQVISLKYELSQKPLILKKEWEVKQ